jgi:hypothetical protein
VEALTAAAELNGTFYAMRILSEGLSLSEIDVVTTEDEYPGTEFSVDEQSFALRLLRRIQSSEKSALHSLSPTVRSEHISRLAARLDRITSEELFNAGLIETDELSDETLLTAAPPATAVSFQFGHPSERPHIVPLFQFHDISSLVKADDTSWPWEEHHLKANVDSVLLCVFLAPDQEDFLVCKFPGMKAYDTELNVKGLHTPSQSTRLMIRESGITSIEWDTEYVSGYQSLVDRHQDLFITFLRKAHEKRTSYVLADLMNREPNPSGAYSPYPLPITLRTFNEMFRWFSFPSHWSPGSPEFQMWIVTQLLEHVLETAKILGVSPGTLLRYLQSR